MPTAYLLAMFTITLWSFLATLGARLRHVPPFLLVGIALTIGGLIGLPRWREWRVPWKTLLVGVWGIFGYHFLLFLAFQNAPAVEANLINYLWPLLIVLLAPFMLPGNTLRPHHVIGALLGLCGAGLIASGGRLNVDLRYLPGYLMAGGAALTWACYSLLTKRVAPFSTAAVAAFCLVSGALSLAAYFGISYSQDLITLNINDWLLLLLLGTGPMGLAFFTWDAALKRGDARIIGSMAYLTPLFSTLNLVVFGGGVFSWVSAAAMILIFGGALVGSLELWRRKQPGQDQKGEL